MGDIDPYTNRRKSGRITASRSVIVLTEEEIQSDTPRISPHPEPSVTRKRKSDSDDEDTNEKISRKRRRGSVESNNKAFKSQDDENSVIKVATNLSSTTGNHLERLRRSTRILSERLRPDSGTNIDKTPRISKRARRSSDRQSVQQSDQSKKLPANKKSRKNQSRRSSPYELLISRAKLRAKSEPPECLPRSQIRPRSSSESRRTSTEHAKIADDDDDDDAEIVIGRTSTNRNASAVGSAVDSDEPDETSEYHDTDSETNIGTTPTKKPNDQNTQFFQTPIRLDSAYSQQPYGLPTPPDTQPRPQRHRKSEVNPDLLTLSRKLSHREPLDTKPQPQGKPLVWAESRQALCETVPYFKMPQSGCHQNDGHVYAFLFDGVGGTREYMDTDVIIARAGGGMEAADSGKMVARKSHDMKDSQVKAMLNDIAHQNPLIIICGNRNEGARCAMPHRYCVLGWYKPITVWAEKTAGKKDSVWTTIKYRFERLKDDEPAWFDPGEATLTDEEREKVGEVVRACCSGCRQEYKQIYLVAWMCLNPECTAFWKVDEDGQEAAYCELDYHPAFILDRTKWQQETEPYSVRPAVPNVGNIIGDNLTKINTRGICCPQCGRCSPRRLWRGWKCDNADCTFEFMPHHRPVKPPMLHNPWDVTGDGPSLSQNKFATGVKVEVEHIEGFKINRYTFEGIDGCLVHAVSNKTINEGRRGPDEMFEAMQRQDGEGETVPLERRRFCTQRTSEGKPEDGDLMMAFSMNYGMPYKFVASGVSQPFEQSPWPVRSCRSTLNRASELFLDRDKHVDLNELLIFAYMEGQKIEYHDDGEKGLGARIATLSLGATAKMYLRMKRKHYVGCSLQGLFTSERPKPGGIDGSEMDRKRLEAWEDLEVMRETDRASYEKRRRQIPQELGLFEKRSKWAPDLVTLTLHHGDIVLMEGYEIQQYLEHKVTAEGNLRFAMTCRTVLEDHLLPDERPDYEVLPDDAADGFL